MLNKLNFKLLPDLNNKCLSRLINTSIINYESNLSLLRKRTGLAFTLCKKALDQNNNDLKEAQKWLTEEVKRTGLEKSQKMSFRVAKEGLVGVQIDEIKKNGCLLEVNCETDFVSKNEKFKKLVSELTKKFSNNPNQNTSNNSISKNILEDENLFHNNDLINTAITHLGEKIKINKALYINSHNTDIDLIGYAHSTEGVNNKLDDISFGKYATIVAFKKLPEDRPKQITEKLKENLEENLTKKEVTNDELIFEDDEDNEPVGYELATKQICQHIIVMDPEIVKKEECKLNKENGNKEETVELYDQDFIHSRNKKVSEFLDINNLEVIDFIKLRCGD